MLVAYDETLTSHLAGVPHVERPDRVRVVADELERRGLFHDRIPTRRATEPEILRAHDRQYVELVKRECEALYDGSTASLSTGDTDVTAASYDGALHAAGGTLAALDRVVRERRAAFALVRPPGHHAEPARGMGFCLFNNAAVAARTFTLETGMPVLVADIDYHHGNGTQALVGGGLSYVSTHASPAYPGTGSDTRANHVDDRGSLANIPLPAGGIETEAFLAIWTFVLRTLAARLEPGLIIVSAGYDFVAGDPVGDLGIAQSAARQLGRVVRDVAGDVCEGRALFVLEGGYDPAVLAACVADTIEGFEENAGAEPAQTASIPASQRAIVEELAV